MPNELGSGFMPVFVGCLTIFLSCCLMVSTLLFNKKTGKKAEKVFGDNVKGGVLTIAAFTIYILLYNMLGFIIASIVYLFAQMMILSDETNCKPWLFAIISIVLPISVYFLFTKGFHLLLPKGVLPI
jgi:putative tricarboxylic transport membrane protein